ncbi:hypothetical protein [Paractinoplanes maris]|uniref:hypothetical protein n=1 Tax=Paractinoplanes maris TaxID=1734446 RepID=UPI00202253DA|nr:hypothetical protein [Actinoplanes maris]
MAQPDEGRYTTWRRNFDLAPGRECGRTVIALSGGGIRSAVFALGAVDALRTHGVLGRTRYLFGVSGGGYAAGAMRLALQKPSKATAEDVFAPGSPELDHLRRHGKYLADGAGGWAAALGVVFRGLVVVQLTMLFVVVLAGYLVGGAYILAGKLGAPFAGLPSGSMLLVTAVLLGVAAVLWLLSIAMENWAGTYVTWAPKLARIARVLTWLGLAVLVVVAVLPPLARASDIDGLGLFDAAGAGAAVAGTGFVATVSAIFLVVRAPISKAVSGLWKARDQIRVIPAFVLQRLLVLAGVVVLVGAHVFVFARVVDTMQQPFAEWPWPLHPVAVAACLIGLVLLGVLIDQTRWSLHPFYKRRLASAFAVHRIDDPARPGQFKAESYAPGTITHLHEYGRKAEGFPQVVHVAAANVSGQALAPPGRRVITYSMSGDYVGGPQLTWIPAADLEHLRWPLRLDSTVQAAMAVSGAAFASAMGASATPFSLLLTLTNARLGTWLPNPAHPGRQAGATFRRTFRQRDLRYMLREIFGRYPLSDPLLFTSDGGHFDNLGLIEALRHRPAEVICVDGSGGATVSGGALGPAIALARQELGIEIDFVGGEPQDLEPGVADKDDKGPLAGRLATASVMTATVTYPDCFPDGRPPAGRLYYGRAVLSAATPWDVLAYAGAHRSFPNDSTADQWFQQQQFDAYHALGEHVGEALAARTRRPAAATPPPGPRAGDG